MKPKNMETVLIWRKASEKMPPINKLIIIKDDDDGTVSEDSTTTGWDKRVTNYSWLEEVEMPIQNKQ